MLRDRAKGTGGRSFRSGAVLVALFALMPGAAWGQQPKTAPVEAGGVAQGGSGPAAGAVGSAGTPTTAAPAKLSAADALAQVKSGFAEIVALVKAGRLPDALVKAEATLALAEAHFPKTHGAVGRSHQYVGDVLFRLKRPADAARHYLTALVVVSRYFDVDKKPYTDAVGRLVAAWDQLGQIKDIAALYEHVLKTTDATPEKETYAHAIYRSRYGRMLRRLGRMKEAEAQFRRSLAIRQRVFKAGDVRIGFAYTDLGGIMRATGRFTEAERYYLAAIESVKGVKGQEANLGILFDNLGTIYGELGRRSDAERVQRQAVALFEQALGPDHLTTGVGYANLAALYYHQRRLNDARPLFEKALAIYRARLPETDLRIGVLLDNYAGLMRTQGHLAEALKMLHTSLSILRRNYPRNHPEVAKAMFNLALAEEEGGHREKAIALTRDSIRMTEIVLGKKHVSLALQLGTLGSYLLDQRKPLLAKAALERAIEIFSRTVGPTHERAIRPLRSLAGLAIALKEYGKALAYSRQAVKAELLRLARNRLDPDGGDQARGVGGALTGSVFVLWEVAQAKPALAKGLDEEAFKVGQWATLTRAGHSISKIGARFAARNPEIAALARERQDLALSWRGADEMLVRLMSLPREKVDQSKVETARAKIAVIDARLAAIDQRFAKEFPAFNSLSQPKPLDVAETRGLLRNNEALVQYVRQGNDLYAWVVTDKAFVWRKVDLAYGKISDKVRALRCGLDPAEWVGETKPLRCLRLLGRGVDDDGALPFDFGAAHDLYEALLAPFEDAIGGRHLIVVASGALSSLPFQVLLTGPVPKGDAQEALRRAPWLLRRNAISVMPSVSSLAALRRNARPSAAREPYLALANPLLVGADGNEQGAFAIKTCGDVKRPDRMILASARPIGAETVLVRGDRADVRSVRHLAPLPETADEVCAVGRSLQAPMGAVWLGAGASEAALKDVDAAGKLSSYRILHFATHGLVSGEISGLKEPALVLTPPAEASAKDDGLLTASEVASLKLDADWVILSACNTAAGSSLEAETMSGLARAFFYAGARSLMVSHWPVQSQAAVRLTTTAMRTLRAYPNTGRAEALRAAMLAMIDNPKSPSDLQPTAWAPFVVVGEAGGISIETARAARRARALAREKAREERMAERRLKFLPRERSWRGQVLGTDD